MQKLALAFILIFVVVCGGAQVKSTPMPGTNPPDSTDTTNPQEPPPTKEMLDMERKQAERRVVERYDSLKKDTDKLLALATELKQQVDKAGPQTLSLDVIKKTKEIEDLSKKIRDKMKTSECPPDQQVCGGE
jgi:hypothetical protein